MNSLKTPSMNMNGLHLNARVAAVLVIFTVALTGSCNCRYTPQASGTHRKLTATTDSTTPFSITINGSMYPSQGGRCAMCSQTYSKCPEGLPVCVDTSSGGSIDLPCDILHLPAHQTATLLTGTTTTATQGDELGDAKPSWQLYLDNSTHPQTSGAGKQQPIGDPGTSGVTADTEDVIMAQCPPEKPTKMCCQVKEIGGEPAVITPAAPPSNNDAGRQQAAVLWVLVSQLVVVLGLILDMS